MEQAVAEAERLMDGFDRPNSGILLVLPIYKAKGMQKRKINERAVTLPPAIQPRWSVQRNSKVSDLLEILDLEPTIVKPDTPLEDVAKAMLEHPNVHIACVVNEEDRLVGIIGLRQLSNDIFFHITPEEFFSEVTSLDAAMEFAAESQKRIASDTMRSPVWIKRDELVKDAFERMHENNLSGLPVVDDRYHVTGYINLLELLAICLEEEPQDTSQEGEK
jgi:CBS domain-containing protein